MSLHAQLSPEAREALDRQRRNTRAASVIIAILGTTLLAVVLGFFGLKAMIPHDPGFEAIVRKPITDDPPIDKPTMSLQSKPAAPAAAAPPMIVASVASPLSIPTPDHPQAPGPAILGDDGDFGLGLGDESGTGPGQFAPIPSNFRKRCSQEDRLALLAESGASAETDEQVVRALRFLKNTQADDGGWGTRHRSAMTGLALLAYLGHCETPLSEEFGESCLQAILFLTEIGMEKKGRLVEDASDRHWPYEHAIATYALAEALSMCRAVNATPPGLSDTVQQAGQLIIDSQHPSGGWDYAYDESGSRGGDLSITGWHVQALKACKLTGLDFRNLPRCVRDALNYVGERQASDGGFGYTGTAPAGDLDYKSLTGVGMLSFQMWGKGSNAAVRKGARYALAEMPLEWNGPDCDLYAHYYLAQAMFQRGGTEWERYQPGFHRALSENQSDDGSWPVPGSGAQVSIPGALFLQDHADGRHYRTVLATLMLEVYYRYLPATR